MDKSASPYMYIYNGSHVLIGGATKATKVGGCGAGNPIQTRPPTGFQHGRWANGRYDYD